MTPVCSRRNFGYIFPRFLVGICLHTLQNRSLCVGADLPFSSMAIGSIHRADVADLVVKSLSAKNTEKKILSAVDPSIASSANPEGLTAEAFTLA